MTTITYLVGDALSVLRTLPDASVDLVLSSPPFLALRSYLPADHPDKAHEMGSEPTPGAFLDGLLDVVEECRRVLAPHGSLCFELGDTYAGSGGGGGGDGWPLDKSLCLIPELLRFALAYGINPLTGRTTERWRVRNVVRWCRPNPPVGALADKVRPATSDILIACTGRKRYFDLDAVRTPSDRAPHTDNRGGHVRDGISGRTRQVMNPVDENGHRIQANANGAPPLDHWWHDDDFGQDAWLVPTAPYKGSHYATWPPALLTKPILAMCPERVCIECGRPSERVTAAADGYSELLGKSWADKEDGRPKAAAGARSAHGGQPIGVPHIKSAEYVTTGWTDCGHAAWRPGVVLDPFAGTGTTGVVAHGHGRSSILIDLDARNLDLCRERFGPLIASQIATSLDPAEATA